MASHKIINMWGKYSIKKWRVEGWGVGSEERIRYIINALHQTNLNIVNRYSETNSITKFTSAHRGDDDDDDGKGESLVIYEDVIKREITYCPLGCHKGRSC